MRCCIAMPTLPILGVVASASVLLALGISGCGRSALQGPLDGSGDGLGDSGQASGGTGPTGGAAATGGSVVGSGGETGTGGATGTGGSPGTGGSIGSGGFTGTGFGGVVGRGGASGTGGLTGRGGTAGIGFGGATARGGASGTGGLTGRGGTAGIGFGSATARGGASGTGGSTGGGGTAGIGLGGATATGGATGVGGSSGAGGTAGTAAGGTTSAGGTTGRGGSAGSGGLTGGTGGIGGAGGAGGTGGGMAAILLQPLVDAFCAAARNCCDLASYPAADLVDCESNFPSRFRYYAMVDQGTVTVDQTALDTCVAAYHTAATACTSTPLHAACRGIFAGAQAEGQPCGGAGKFGGFECRAVQGSSNCYWADTQGYPATSGVCVGIARGSSGDACGRTCLRNQDCVANMLGGSAPFPVVCFEEDGLYCSTRSNPAVCKPTVQLGETCTSDTGACGSGNVCSWTSDACQPAPQLGESCQTAYCATWLECGSSLRCVEVPLASQSTCQGTPSVP